MNASGVRSMLQPVRRTRISDEVVVRLTNLILAGQVAPGGKLPPERELAAQLAVNRTSVREALRRLETMGLVQIRPGDGVLVNDPDVSSGLEFLRFVIATGIGLDRELVLNLAEMRRVFATPMIEMAARRADEADVAALEAIVESYGEADAAARATGAPDFEFFRQMAVATKNKVFIYLLNTAREFFESFSALYFEVEGDRETAARTYRKLVDAIREHNAKKAVRVFAAQMQKDDERLEAMLEGMK